MALFYKKLLLIIYFCFINVLFCLPGSAFPQENWLDTIWFDKWVHIGFFSVLCFGICWVFGGRGARFYLLLLIGAGAYGLLVEFIQDLYIPNRSFDIGDWVADVIGSASGIKAWQWWTGRVRAKK